PGLFISFLFDRRAILFDLGDIYNLSPKDILKLTHIFLTHTHMDHFVGFDRLLRLFLGREKKLAMFGPEGFLKNVEGKLAGYSWNLVGQYKNGFTLQATEVKPDCLLTRQYVCRNGFLPTGEAEKKDFDSILLHEPGLSVKMAILDHSIPCLGFAITEQMHINIIKDRLLELKLETGPWLKDFKNALFTGKNPNAEFEVRLGNKDPKTRKFVLSDLSDRIARITSGQKISYISDIVYNDSNVKKTVKLVKNSDYLFIEAAFLEEQKTIAETKYHLTARQAGTIARKARVKNLSLFHFSPRYTGKSHLLYKEADDAFKNRQSES
ncbi:ribonuclease Z, partial [Thermodesulfobacteriota bacterium]